MGIDRRRYLMAASAGAVDAPEYAVVAMALSETSKYTLYSGSIDGGVTWYGGTNNRHSTPVISGSFQILPTGYAYRVTSRKTSDWTTNLEYINILSEGRITYGTASMLNGYSGKFALSRDKILFEYYVGRSYENYLAIGAGSIDMYEDPEISLSPITGSIVSYLDYEDSYDMDFVKQIAISEDGQTAIAIMSQSNYANTDVIARYSEGGLTYGTWETILIDSQSSGGIPHSVDISNDGQVCVITTSRGYYFSRTGPSNLRYTASYAVNSGIINPGRGCSVSGNGKVICISGDYTISVSVDCGTTWTGKYVEDLHEADKVVSNYKGDKILLNKLGVLYGSVDYGNTFTQITFNGSNDYVRDVAMNKWRKFKK